MAFDRTTPKPNNENGTKMNWFRDIFITRSQLATTVIASTAAVLPVVGKLAAGALITQPLTAMHGETPPAKLPGDRSGFAAFAASGIVDFHGLHCFESKSARLRTLNSSSQAGMDGKS